MMGMNPMARPGFPPGESKDTASAPCMPDIAAHYTGRMRASAAVIRINMLCLTCCLSYDVPTFCQAWAGPLS